MINRSIYGANKELKYSIDHNKNLLVLEGQDKLTAIGDPPVPGEMSLDQAWTMSIQSYFPLKNSLADEVDEKENDEISSSKYSEPKVDAMRIQKEEELERYKKELDAKKRLEEKRKQAKVINKKNIMVKKQADN